MFLQVVAWQIVFMSTPCSNTTEVAIVSGALTFDCMVPVCRRTRHLFVGQSDSVSELACNNLFGGRFIASMFILFHLWNSSRAWATSISMRNCAFQACVPADEPTIYMEASTSYWNLGTMLTNPAVD